MDRGQPTKKLKMDIEIGDQSTMSMEVEVLQGPDDGDRKQSVEVFRSPITTPMLLPEVFNIT